MAGGWEMSSWTETFRLENGSEGEGAVPSPGAEPEGQSWQIGLTCRHSPNLHVFKEAAGNTNPLSPIDTSNCQQARTYLSCRKRQSLFFPFYIFTNLCLEIKVPVAQAALQLMISI